MLINGMWEVSVKMFFFTVYILLKINFPKSPGSDKNPVAWGFIWLIEWNFARVKMKQTIV